MRFQTTAGDYFFLEADEIAFVTAHANPEGVATGSVLHAVDGLSRSCTDVAATLASTLSLTPHTVDRSDAHFPGIAQNSDGTRTVYARSDVVSYRIENAALRKLAQGKQSFVVLAS